MIQTNMERISPKTKEELENAVAKAAEVLSSGGLIIYPTDTLYGIAVDATNHEAVAKVYELKGREKTKPLSVVVSDIKMAEDYASMNDLAEKVFAKMLPGAITLLMPKKEVVLEDLTQGSGDLGVRIPDSYFCITLAQKFGKPYTATSANVSGEEYIGDLDKMLEQFGDKSELVDLIIDVGELDSKNASTILRIKDNSVEIVREGEVNLQAVTMVTKPEL